MYYPIEDCFLDRTHDRAPDQPSVLAYISPNHTVSYVLSIVYDSTASHIPVIPRCLNQLFSRPDMPLVTSPSG